MYRSNRLAPQLRKRFLSTSAYQGNNVLGIVREDFSMWERRAPLCPRRVNDLVRQGTKVLIQPCTKRIFTDSEYTEAGATVTNDLSPAGLIIGIKQIMASKIMPDKQYMFFSHTIKAQAGNMELLDKMLSNKVRFFDYECILDGGVDGAPRSVAFGKYAGVAGMFDGLQGLGQRLLAEGVSTPFLNVPLAYTYQNMDQARLNLRNIGNQIERLGFPSSISPIVFAFTGSGNVTKGAREIFELLPHECVSVEDLPALTADVKSGKRKNNKIYAVLTSATDMVKRKIVGADGSITYAPCTDKSHYYANPSEYEGCYHENVIPYTTMLVNCFYWDHKFPRLITNDQIRELRATGNHNLRAVADITCDPAGSVEFLSHCTPIEKPFFSYNPETGVETEDSCDKSILMLGVEILPSELPRDATEFFGRQLFRFLPSLLASPSSSSQGDWPSALGPELQKACIVSHGQMMPKFEYITEMRQQRDRETAEKLKSQKRVLLFGAGMVAMPVLRYFESQEDVQLVIASDNSAQANELISQLGDASRMRFEQFAMPGDATKLAGLIENCDVAISLLPVTMHLPIAEACIAQKKHMVTASYVSPGMQALDTHAKEAGITLFNEAGLDPGIDHMLVMKAVDSIKSRGGVVKELVSLCGGLPDPAAADNPFRYKFSWSPKGVLLAAGNGASYLKDSSLVQVQPGSLLETAALCSRFPTLRLEALPNRDSIQYKEIYGVAEAASICRGTLRYEGGSNVMLALKTLGMFDTEQKVDATWTDLLKRTTGATELTRQSIIEFLASKGLADPAAAVEAIEYLGILNGDVALESSTPIDSICAVLQRNLQYAPGEKDMVAMYHSVTGELPDGSSEEHASRLLAFGVPGGDSAMASTVGYTTAIAAELILRKEIPEVHGVVIPTDSDVYMPMLNKLEQTGVYWQESVNVTPASKR